MEGALVGLSWMERGLSLPIFATQGFFGGNSQWSRDGGFGVIIIEIETPEPVDKDIF